MQTAKRKKQDRAGGDSYEQTPFQLSSNRIVDIRRITKAQRRVLDQMKALSIIHKAQLRPTKTGNPISPRRYHISVNGYIKETGIRQSIVDALYSKKRLDRFAKNDDVYYTLVEREINFKDNKVDLPSESERAKFMESSPYKLGKK